MIPAQRPSAGRVLDALALLLIAGGVALYGYAHVGMRALELERIARVPGHMLMEDFDRYWRLSRVALSLAGLGVLAGTVSYFRFFRGRPAATTPP